MLVRLEPAFIGIQAIMNDDILRLNVRMDQADTTQRFERLRDYEANAVSVGILKLML